MDIHRVCALIAQNALSSLEDVTPDQIAYFRRRVEGAASIFCVAQGRSGYVLRCFCMRLMHMGYRAYFAGETVTPPMGPGDILVALSGSGRTSCTCALIERAKAAGGRTFGILGTRHSPMEGSLDDVISIEVKSSDPNETGTVSLIQPLGSPFEQAAFMLLEAVAQDLFERQGGDQRALQQRHTNLE